MSEDWKGQPSATMTDYEVARIGYNNTVHGVPPTAEEVHNLACACQASQARLSEAVKVLEEILSACEEVILFQGEQVTGHILKNAIDRSSARQFLATLGEENE